MTRRRHVALGARLAALVAGAAGSVAVSEHHRLERTGRVHARAAQERAASAAALPARPAPSGRARRACPPGAASLAAEIARILPVQLLDDRGRLDPAALARLSAETLAAERRAERRAGGPFLPQRMGRQRVTGADGTVSWQPLEASHLPCAPIPPRR